MNETGTTPSIFDARLSAEDRDFQVWYESLGLSPQVIDGNLCLSKTDVLRLCRMTNTKKAAEFEKWIRRNFP
jgi:hypothetical protein